MLGSLGCGVCNSEFTDSLLEMLGNCALQDIRIHEVDSQVNTEAGKTAWGARRGGSGPG